MKISESEINIIKEFNEIIKKEDTEKETIIEELSKFNVRDKVMESISHDCDELIKSNKGGEKVKERREEFLEDYKKYKNVNEIKKTAMGKKWAQSGPFQFDYDASYFSSRVYCRTNFAKRKTNAKICEEKGYIYTVKVNNEEFRGDTMNSWYTTLERFLNEYAEAGYFNRLRNENESWVDYLINSDEVKDMPLPPYIEEFIKVVYTIGNFIPVPCSDRKRNFNTVRFAPTQDYWDLTLKAIHDHYMGNSEKQTWLSELLGKEESISNWLCEEGQEGWNDFVRSNFMEPFVKKNGDNFGEPYELWDGHFNGYGYILPKKEPQFEQFFVNAKVRICERGKLIAKKLIDNQKDEQFYNDDCKSDK